MKPFFSIIIPVYNRPHELRELVHSLSLQTFRSFELIVVEDGSDVQSDEVLLPYRDKMTIHYHFQENTGPAIARNAGMAIAEGEFFLFTDSDCVVPESWLESIHHKLSNSSVDAFGGPDLAAMDFSLLQKAISFAMTSFFTTGGIRGGKRHIGRFHPRSFNMGISRMIYEETGGFPVTRMHPGEDMVFTVEIIRRGFETAYFADSGVYHKRRNTLKSFFRQVFRFGKTRYIIGQVYPETRKWVFWLPSLMVIAGILSIMLSLFFSGYFLFPLILYAVLIFIAATLPYGCVRLGLLSLMTSVVQIVGYGGGFLTSLIRIKIMGVDEYGVLKQGFYSAR